MSNAPLISVIVPVYNGEKYLANCLDSILGQDFNDIEVLCINDGSTDSSAEILRSYAERDRRVRVITQKNQGVSKARNAGLDAATGEWIAFVDNDDEVMPSIWITLLANAGNEDLICFSADEIGVKEGKEFPITSGYFQLKFSGMHELTDNDLLKLSMTVWDKLFRRSRIEECALRFPEGMRFEDNVFVLNFTSIYRKALFLPHKLYRYFRREDAFMNSVKQKKTKVAFDCIRILDPIYRFWSTNGLFPHMQAVFERICFDRLREAINICLPWERPGIAYALAENLQRWEFIPLRKELLALREGNLALYLAPFPGTEITMLKPLRGWQKIFYMGNCQEKKIIRLFGIKILSW
ncbi:glycosyltransferase [Mailhella sp.]|uniref:glycosyltransferase n=1 Tax=Mailhella sp. TaxID=1981029 RepID=UPI0040643787